MIPWTPERVAEATHQPLPPRFEAHHYEAEARSPLARDVVWAWLCAPETFTKGQPPPYRVEFVHPEGGREGTFEIGTPNAHHGPWLIAAGLIGDVRDGAYRDLRYFYGSHVLSMRWIRPVRLQFWLEDTDEGGTLLRWRMDAQVRKGWGGFWSFVQGGFWKAFRWTITRGARAHARRTGRA